MNSVKTSIRNAPFRKVNFAPVDLDIQRFEDGSLTLKSNLTLTLREHHLPAYLRRHAKARPNRVWLAQRAPDSGEWTTLTFGEALKKVNALTQGLLDMGLQPGQCVAILSNNTIEHALLKLACMQARVIVSSISVAYSLQSSDHVKLKEVINTLAPAAFFVQNAKVFEKALKAIDAEQAKVIAVQEPLPENVNFLDLLNSEVTAAVDESVSNIQPDDVARIMFTSGSTGSPKGVPGTHKAIVITAESNLLTNGNTAEGEMIRLDWLPWNHVFGATGLSLTIVSGGTFYIDNGRPMGPMFKETLKNLAEIGPTNFSSVPSAYAMLVEALEKDDAFAQQFFNKIKILGYGGASLPEDTVHRIQALSVKYTGTKTPISTAYAATETGAGGAFIYWPTDRTGLIGLPHAGFELKLVPIDATRYELRVRGEAVTSGYYRRPDLNSNIFDEENFYKVGDAVEFADPDNILEGLVFKGRLSEEFKLTSGTFVLVGSLRLQMLRALAPLVSEVVICGENQHYIAVMAWINMDAAQKFIGTQNISREELNRHPKIIEHISASLRQYNQKNSSQSKRVERYTLLDEAPSIDKSEVTDKGSINQRGVQANRAKIVNKLFTAEIQEGVISLMDC